MYKQRKFKQGSVDTTFKPEQYYDGETPFIEELMDTNINVNPDFYIHIAIIKLQNALMSENLIEGLIKYRLLGEHLETLCRAANMLPENYDEQLSLYKETDEFKNAESNLISHAKIANKKTEIILNMFFKKKPINQTLTL